MCYTIFLDCGDSKNRFNMIPPSRNNAAGKLAMKNNIKILWENTELIAMDVQNRKKPWGSQETSQKRQC